MPDLTSLLAVARLDAIHILGGYGHMTEQQVERDLRDSVEDQRNIIARGLGL